jgi:hypothetical protein
MIVHINQIEDNKPGSGIPQHFLGADSKYFKKKYYMNDHQIDLLKSHIESHLKEADVFTSIRQFVKNYVKSAENTSGEGRDHILNALKEKGVIESIVKSLDERYMHLTWTFMLSYISPPL